MIQGIIQDSSQVYLRDIKETCILNIFKINAYWISKKKPCLWNKDTLGQRDNNSST